MRTLTDEDVEAIAQRVVELLDHGRPPAVLNLREAMKLAGRGSCSAFHRWNDKFGPVECGHGRFSRERIERALLRESKK